MERVLWDEYQIAFAHILYFIANFEIYVALNDYE